MQKLLHLMLVLVVTFGLALGDANAKRFGGGKSFGKQRQTTEQAAPKSPAQQQAAPAAAVQGSRWLGPLAGLAAGGLLGALLFGHAFDGIKAMDILLLLGGAALIFMMFRMMRRKSEGSLHYAAHGARGFEQSRTSEEPLGNPMSFSNGARRSTRPAWFQDEPFLREAKSHFLRLQAAYDARDLNDIREYTTPEVFAEISLQIQERADAPQHTEVITLNADMADVAQENDMVIASVRFSGMIREQKGGPAEPFSEIWHIQKSLGNSSNPWLIAGIQQA